MGDLAKITLSGDFVGLLPWLMSASRMEGGRDMPVVGMGGFFFRARDPDAIKAWYRERLGVGAGCGTDENGASDEHCWHAEAGPIVWEPMREDSDHFAPDRQVMINLRVRGMDDLLARLAAAGIEIVTRSEWDTPETGRFARIHDPEGNPIELWEPPVE
jgi:predicted enzyme related to lactoylglutathione lyase